MYDVDFHGCNAGIYIVRCILNLLSNQINHYRNEALPFLKVVFLNFTITAILSKEKSVEKDLDTGWAKSLLVFSERPIKLPMK